MPVTMRIAPVPTAMRTRSLRAQIATTSPMCSRRTPCRSTQAFWAPMATMRPSPVPKPVRAGARSSDAGSPAGADMAEAAEAPVRAEVRRAVNETIMRRG